MGATKAVVTMRLEPSAVKRLDRMIEIVRKRTGEKFTRSEALRALVFDLLNGTIRTTAKTSKFTQEVIEELLSKK